MKRLQKIMSNGGDLKLKQKCQRLYCEKISNYEHYKFHRKQEKWPTGLVLDLEEHESVLNLKM
jgi:hypothetical protein